MKYTVSLKGNRAFHRLYNKGKCFPQGAVVVYARRNGGQTSRLGLTVGTKVGKAVVRNKIRRRLREIYRLHESEMKCGWDIVIVARSRAKEVPYRVLESEFLRAAEKLGLRKA